MPNSGSRRNQVTVLDNRGLRYWLSAWVPVAIGVAVIALESSELMSANHTSYPLRLLLKESSGQLAAPGGKPYMARFASPATFWATDRSDWHGCAPGG